MPDPGARRIPASPASMKPTIQAKPAIRLVRAPVSEARLGSSTTARMETPTRVSLKSAHRASATTTAHPMVIRSSYVRVTPNTVTWSPRNHWGRFRVISWFQMVETKP